jgi:hypothetical protein
VGAAGDAAAAGAGATTAASAATELRAPPAADCGAAGTLECPSYARYVNHRYGFSVDVPTFFVRKAADADGRGQPFEYAAGKARMRAWAMVDNPPMTVDQLYADWTRRERVTFKTLAMNTWVVRGKEQGRLYYSRSVLADGIISTVEVSYAPEIADALEPILARVGSSMMTIPGEGVRRGARYY